MPAPFLRLHPGQATVAPGSCWGCCDPPPHADRPAPPARSIIASQSLACCCSAVGSHRTGDAGPLLCAGLPDPPAPWPHAPKRWVFSPSGESVHLLPLFLCFFWFSCLAPSLLPDSRQREHLITRAAKLSLKCVLLSPKPPRGLVWPLDLQGWGPILPEMGSPGWLQALTCLGARRNRRGFAPGVDFHTSGLCVCNGHRRAQG